MPIKRTFVLGQLVFFLFAIYGADGADLSAKKDLGLLKLSLEPIGA